VKNSAFSFTFLKEKSICGISQMLSTPVSLLEHMAEHYLCFTLYYAGCVCKREALQRCGLQSK
jgi:hypothetical protein